MNLEKTSFDKLEKQSECLFRTEKGRIVHARKVQENVIAEVMSERRAFTGQYHEVWEIDPKGKSESSFDGSEKKRVEQVGEWGTHSIATSLHQQRGADQ